MKWYICRTIVSYLSPQQIVRPTIKQHHHQHHPNQQEVIPHILPQVIAPLEANNPSQVPRFTTVTRRIIPQKNLQNPQQNRKVLKRHLNNPLFVHGVPRKSRNNNSNKRLLQKSVHLSSRFPVVANQKHRNEDFHFPITCHRVANVHQTVRRVAASQKVPVHQDLRQVKAISVLTNSCVVWKAIFGTNRVCELLRFIRFGLSLLCGLLCSTNTKSSLFEAKIIRVEIACE